MNVGSHYIQRTGIADGRAIEKLSPEQKIVNEQKLHIMNQKSIEAGQPEQKLNSEQQNSIISSPPAIGNTNVVCQGGFTDVEIEEMAIKEIVYNDVKRAWWIEGAKYINKQLKKL